MAKLRERCAPWDGQDVTIRDMDIRSALAHDVARRIGEQSFELWFDSGNALALTGDRLLVQAGSQFKLDRIRAAYHQSLAESCREIVGAEPNIVYELQPDDAGNAPTNGKRISIAVSQTEEVSALESAATSNHLQRRRFANLRTFVAGESNRLALTSCEMIADRPGEISPLFLYGPPGVGKTHLLEGVWSAIRSRRRFARVVYLSAEQFTSYFLEALKSGGLPSFRRKYRKSDVLILDDVQFFAGKKATVDELQHTVDEMLRDGRQLVLAADRPPGQLTQLGESLMARLASGMICTLRTAERETRLAIARQMATARKIDVSRGVLEYLADQFPGDARQLSGALNRLQTMAKAYSQRIDLALAQSALADLIRANHRAVRLGDIESAVCECLGLEKSQLQSPVKTKSIAHPRMLAMYLARKHTPAGLAEIGDHFGHRSHTTVVSAEKRVNQWLDKSTPLTAAGRTWSIHDAIEQIEGRLRVG